jgi:quinoprotein relay system zinc metallohydrolase 1
MKFGFCICIRAGLAALLTSSLLAHAAMDIALPAANPGTLDYGLKASPLPGGWHVLAGSNDDFSLANGCNIINTGFWVDANSVVVINTGVSRLYGEQQAALIERTAKLPVRDVLTLNLHPDYFFGNQAFSKATLLGTEQTIAGAQREGPAYADNLYRLCGDWMKGTESTPPQVRLAPGEKRFGKAGIELLELQGHTDSDLVVFDRTHGVLWAGGLVFKQRVPTMPHARIAPWIESLKTLQQLPIKVLIPSHGPVSEGIGAITETLDYLRWFDGLMKTSAAQGLELNEVLRLPIPERFRNWAAMPVEYARNVSSLYPRYEADSLK